MTALAEPFAMSLPAVSKHIKVLERARLVERSIDGRVHECALSPKPLERVERWLAQQRGFWDQTLQSLADYVEDGGPEDDERR